MKKKNQQRNKNIVPLHIYVDRELNGNLEMGEWWSQVFESQFFNEIPRTDSNNAARNLFNVRDKLAQFFVSPEGSVPWQENPIQRGRKRKRNICV